MSEIPKTHEYDITGNHGVTSAYTTIQTDADGNPIPCVAISCNTSGNYTLTNADKTSSTQVIYLLSGTLHFISTKVALGAGAGTALYWY